MRSSHANDNRSTRDNRPATRPASTLPPVQPANLLPATLSEFLNRWRFRRAITGRPFNPRPKDYARRLTLIEQIAANTACALYELVLAEVKPRTLSHPDHGATLGELRLSDPEFSLGPIARIPFYDRDILELHGLQPVEDAIRQFSVEHFLPLIGTLVKQRRRGGPATAHVPQWMLAELMDTIRHALREYQKTTPECRAA